MASGTYTCQACVDAERKKREADDLEAWEGSLNGMSVPILAQQLSELKVFVRARRLGEFRARFAAFRRAMLQSLFRMSMPLLRRRLPLDLAQHVFAQAWLIHGSANCVPPSTECVLNDEWETLNSVCDLIQRHEQNERQYDMAPTGRMDVTNESRIFSPTIIKTLEHLAKGSSPAEAGNAATASLTGPPVTADAVIMPRHTPPVTACAVIQLPSPGAVASTQKNNCTLCKRSLYFSTRDTCNACSCHKCGMPKANGKCPKCNTFS